MNRNSDPALATVKTRESRRKLIVGSALGAAILLSFAIGKATGGGSEAVAASTPEPMVVTMQGDTLTKRVEVPVTVTVTASAPAPVKPQSKADEYNVVYKVIGTGPVGLTWNSAVYDAADPDHGTVQKSVTLPTEDIAITAHQGDSVSILASLDLHEPGKIERCEIWVDGVKVADEAANNAGTYVSCVEWL